MFMARLYCRIVGPVLLLVGVLGVVQFGIPGFLSINEPAEIALHFITGAFAPYAGLSRGYGRAAVLCPSVRSRLPVADPRRLHPAGPPPGNSLGPGLQPGAPGPRGLGHLRRLLRAGDYSRPGCLV